MTRLVLTLLTVLVCVCLQGPAHADDIYPGATWGDLHATQSALGDAIRSHGLDEKEKDKTDDKKVFVVEKLFSVPSEAEFQSTNDLSKLEWAYENDALKPAIATEDPVVLAANLTEFAARKARLDFRYKAIKGIKAVVAARKAQQLTTASNAQPSAATEAPRAAASAPTAATPVATEVPSTEAPITTTVSRVTPVEPKSVIGQRVRVQDPMVTRLQTENERLRKAVARQRTELASQPIPVSPLTKKERAEFDQLRADSRGLVASNRNLTALNAVSAKSLHEAKARVQKAEQAADDLAIERDQLKQVRSSAYVPWYMTCLLLVLLGAGVYLYIDKWGRDSEIKDHEKAAAKRRADIVSQWQAQLAAQQHQHEQTRTMVNTMFATIYETWQHHADAPPFTKLQLTSDRSEDQRIIKEMTDSLASVSQVLFQAINDRKQSDRDKLRHVAEHDNIQANFAQQQQVLDHLQRQLDHFQVIAPVIEPLKLLSERKDVIVDILTIVARSAANDRTINQADALRLIVEKELFLDEEEGEGSLKISFRRAYGKMAKNKGKRW